jgi:hypothetical protein
MLYDFRDHRSKAVKNTAVAAKIGEVLQSIKRISDFSRSLESGDAAAAAALLSIAGMGEIWADRYSEDLPLMFRPTLVNGEEGDTIDYGGSGVIASFLAAASSVHRIAADAQKALLAEPDARPMQSAIVWLAGSELPRLYERFIGKFATRTETSTDGIEFVRLALKATGVRESISVETVRSHIQTAKRVSLAGNF